MENNTVEKEQVIYDAPQKSFTATLLLNFFLGFLGIHRFYTGYIGIGIAQLLTFGGCGIWTLIDYIMIIADKYNDKDDRPLADYNKQLAIGSLIVILILSLVTNFNMQDKSSDDKNMNIINKADFIGIWALTVDSAKLHHVKVTEQLNGVEITINNKTYALTRNIVDREFLPNNLWANAEFQQVGQYKVCNDVMLDKKTCKKSLSDIIHYAEKLPIEN
mgnify:CR=1 FL=1